MAKHFMTHRRQLPVVVRSAASFLCWLIWSGGAPAHAGSVTVDLSVLDHPSRGPSPVVRSGGPRIVLKPPPGMRRHKFPDRGGSAAAPSARQVKRPARPRPDREKIRESRRTAPSAAPRAAAPGAPKSSKGFGPGQRYRLRFQAGASALDVAARRTLDGLVGKLGGTGFRLKLMAYAGGVAETESQARWVSLSRALSVRKYLAAKGIDSGRIDVRARGRKYSEGPPERVDVIVIRR